MMFDTEINSPVSLPGESALRALPVRGNVREGKLYIIPFSFRVRKTGNYRFPSLLLYVYIFADEPVIYEILL